jgi:hypothetical protein
VPYMNPLKKDVLREASEGADISGLVSPLCMNCINLKRISINLEERIAEMTRKKNFKKVSSVISVEI